MFDSSYEDEINQIESIAETKGIDIDDIEVTETATDDGDDMVVFRILETKAETEEDSVGVQVSKVPSVQTGDMVFRNDVQQKLNSLKKYLSGPNENSEPSEVTDGDVSDDYGTSSTGRNQQRKRSVTDADGSGPGSEIDARIRALEAEYEELDERLSELEDKAEALDGLQKLMGDSDD